MNGNYLGDKEIKKNGHVVRQTLDRHTVHTDKKTESQIALQSAEKICWYVVKVCVGGLIKYTPINPAYR